MHRTANLVPYMGPARPVAVGGHIDYPMDFLKYEDRKGFRNVIHRFDIWLTANIDVAEGDDIQGEDLAELLAHVLIKDRMGRLVDLAGWENRHHTFFACGTHAPNDPADVADLADDTDVTYRHIIPFAHPRMFRPKDFAVPVEHLKDEASTVRFTVAAGNLSSGAAITWNSDITVKLVAWCAGEYDFETKSRWTALSQSTDDNTEFAIKNIANRPLLLLGLNKQGASGGATTASITGVDCELLNYHNVRDEELEEGYRMGRHVGDFIFGRDPWDHLGADAANAKAFPLLWANSRSKLTQLAMVGANPEIELTGSTVTDPLVLKSYITPPSTEDIEESAAARGVELAGAAARGLDGKAISGEDPFQAFLNKKVAGKVGRYIRR